MLGFEIGGRCDKANRVVQRLVIVGKQENDSEDWDYKQTYPQDEYESAKNRAMEKFNEMFPDTPIQYIKCAYKRAIVIP